MAKRFDLAKKYTEKYKGVLLPCKFCGSKDIVIVSDRTIWGKLKNVWSVGCTTPNCDCVCFYSSVKEAVKAWNERQSKTIKRR